MNILALKINHKAILKLMLSAILTFQVILFNAPIVSSTNKNILLDPGSMVISDVA